MESPAFQLRAELSGHEEDVRCVSSSPLGILTGSRDKTVRIWKEAASGQISCEHVLVGHTSYVTALVYIPPGASSTYPQGTIISGSRDATLIAWNLRSYAPVHHLRGHKYQISSAALLSDGRVASASLDSTIRIWQGEECVERLEGHEGAVLCLAALPGPGARLLSGGGDTTIRLWAESKCAGIFTGHTDTVRGLCVIPDVGVVSASHDQTLRLWSFAGETLAELVGHTALIYSAAAHASSGLIASASEDNTSRLWQGDGSCLQSLPHPRCVWDADFLPNGDLITACADHFVRIWTTAPERAAAADVIEAYNASMAAASSAGQDNGGGQSSYAGAMEDAEVLARPGTKDGQTKIIKEQGAAVAYTWDQSRGEWEKVGEVMGSAGGGGGGDTMAGGDRMHAGQQWDFVFDVDVDPNQPPLKLACNRGDNPYDVADRFMEQENLPITYRQQIVDFVLQNTAGALAMPAPVTANVDPFTGAGAYQPTASHGRSAPANLDGPNVDPFTGSAASAAERGQSTRLRHCPQTSYLIMDTLPKADALASKVRQFNIQVKQGTDMQSVLLSEEEAAPSGALDLLIQRSLQCTAARSSSQGQQADGASLSQQDLSLLSRLLRWPAPHLFPALDIARLAILEEQAAVSIASTAGPLLLSPQGDIGAALATAFADPPIPANVQVGLRLACNTFRHAPLRNWVHSNQAAMLDAFAPACTSPLKPVRLALATFLLNLSTLLHSSRQAAEAGVKAQALSAISELLSTCTADDSEALFRMLVAAGTFVMGDSEAKSIAAQLGILGDAIKLSLTGRGAEALSDLQAVMK